MGLVGPLNSRQIYPHLGQAQRKILVLNYCLAGIVLIAVAEVVKTLVAITGRFKTLDEFRFGKNTPVVG